MANYIVTGAAGYIGSVLCKRLKELGHEITAIDLETPNHSYYDNIILTNYDVEDALSTPIAQCDGIFHLAASSLLNPSLEDPLSYYENNVGSVLKLLKIIQRYNPVVPIVFASSAAVYGESEELCCAQYSTCSPINPYGFTKIQIEQALDDITKYTGELPHISFRFFNVAGGYGDVGHKITRPALLPSLSRAVINKTPFNIYSDTLRDYIHVLDVCNAMIIGQDLLKTNKITYTSLNLCSGNLTSCSDVVDMFAEYTHNDFEIIQAGHREGDPLILKGDAEYTMTTLNWRPMFSNWPDMINSHWEYTQYEQGKL
jgi:UDP-glucose 4-epimerase